MGYNYRKGGMPHPHTSVKSDSTYKGQKPKPQGDGHAEAERTAADKQAMTYGNLGKQAKSKAEEGFMRSNYSKSTIEYNKAGKLFAKSDSVAEANDTPYRTYDGIDTGTKRRR